MRNARSRSLFESVQRNRLRRCARLAQVGYGPVGALTLPSWDRSTLVRKVGQWGLRGSFNYAVTKLAPRKAGNHKKVLNSVPREIASPRRQDLPRVA